MRTPEDYPVLLRVSANIVIFFILTYICMYLTLTGYGVISIRVEESIVSPTNGTSTPPPYHPDIVIYESQKSPENPLKVPYILTAVFLAFLLVYVILKLDPKVLKWIIGLSMYVSSVYALRGIFHSLSIIYPIVLGFPLVAVIFYKNTPSEVKSALLAIVIGGIGALLGSMAYPILWVAILTALVCYDVWGVYRGPIRHISEEALRLEIPLLVKISVKEEEHLIGLGDYALPMSFLASLMKYESVFYSFVSFVGFILGAIIALIIARRKGPQPGLLYIVPLGVVPYLILKFIITTCL
ncbi:MAG: hypothetical protein J7K58_03290 [Euryarchaeota archaeon]|nr:hypothetical protein [Euryarchaeota archaeon]